MRFPHSNPSNESANGRLQKVKILALVVFSILSGQAYASAANTGLQSLTLEWSPVSEASVQGYLVHVGTQSQQYSLVYDSGTAVSFSVNDLEVGKTYYFAVGAVDNTGTEGGLSTELMVTIAPPPLPGGTSISMNASGQPALQWTFPTSEAGSSPDFIVYSSDDLINWTVAGTIPVSASTGWDGPVLNFSWPIQTTEQRKFFRLTARNWMGDSTAP